MFKSWSIKAQLQFLAISTVVFVLIIAAMLNFAHRIVESTQDSFSGKLMPISGYSRQMNNAVAALIQHHQQVSMATNEAVLDSLADREELERTFENNWNELSELMANNEAETELITSLHQFYEDFLELDNDLLEFKRQYVNAIAQIQNRNHAIQNQLLEFKTGYESLNKAVLASGGVYATDLVQALKQDIQQLEAVLYQLLELDNDEHLSLIEKNQLAPLLNTTREALTNLQYQLTGTEDIKAVNDLIQQNKALTKLIDGKQGLVSSKKDAILATSLLHQTQESISAVISVMLNKQAELAESVNQHIYEAVSSNTVAVEKTRWKIILLGSFITSIMLLFTFLLIRNINVALLTIRNGLHSLSEGKFEIRLPVQKNHDELDLLVQDFNRFAENTEQLLGDFVEARHSVEKQGQQLRAILNAVPEAILTISTEGLIEGANPAAEKVLEASQQQLLGEDIRRFFAEGSVSWTIENIAEKAKSGYEFSGVTFREQLITMQVELRQVSDVDGDVWVCVISDVTMLKQTDRQLHQTSSELNAIFDNAMVGIALIRDRTFVRVNHKFEELFMYNREEIEGSGTELLYPNPQAHKQFGSQAYAALSQGLGYEAQIEMRRQNGELFWCALSGKVIDYENPSTGSIWLFEDVTQQRQNEEHLVKLASIDTLTGLPNRAVFNDRLAHAIHKAHRNSGRLAVFFMDLDHFKVINDSLGHRVGDMLLIEVARRVKSCLREGDTVARLGGDEFTLIMEDITTSEYVGKVAEKVLHAASQPYMIDGTEINVSPSIGISLYPADGRDLDMLIRNADAAMYHAKNSGRNNFQFYSAEMNAQAAERLAMETSLRKAVENKEFYLHYQPQVDLTTGEIAGAEALLRWSSSQWGDVSPAKFVPILEDTGLISTVGEFVLEQACHTYLETAEHLPIDFKMAVNLSGRQFKGGNLSRRISHILLETGMSSKNLELEITESMLMEDTQLATETLYELSQQGITLAIDDFGTGYSSLSYLKQFPLNVLKIDGSFVRDITTDIDDAAIVDAILAMANSLNLSVVAEGVEQQAQLRYLMERSCTLAQGYFFSKPLDKDAFIEFIQQPVQLN